MLEELFTLYYSIDDTKQLDKLKKKINKLKIHNILNINKKIRNQFIILVFENQEYIYFNIFQKEFNINNKKWGPKCMYKFTIVIDDINECEDEIYDWMDIEPESEIKNTKTLNNNLEIEQNLSLIENGDTNLENNNNLIESNNTSDQNLNLIENNNNLEQNLNLIEDEDNLIEEENNLANEIDYNENLDEEYDDELELFLTLDDIIDNNLDNLHFIESEILTSYIDIFDDQISDNLNSEIINNNYGVLLYSNDIRWQVLIKNILNIYIGNRGKLINYFNHKEFIETTIKNAYFFNYNSKSIYEKYLYEKINIVCDLCKNVIDTTQNIMHNPECGDICINCFKKKIEYDNNKINLFKKKILSMGRRVVFKRELKKTEKFLENYNFKKLNISKKYEICKKVNHELMENDLDFENCGICLSKMNKNICSGLCGHCFHIECINQWKRFECPICRIQTNFKKLYL
jgi:hypothetical protein